MIKEITTFGGVLLVALGLLGFAVPRFIGMDLSPLHNVLNLFSGAVAIYFGLKATQAAARTACILFGAVYGVLGLAGFVAGGQNYILTILPGTMVLGVMDHLIHLIVGVVFLSVGCTWRPAMPIRLR